MDSCPSLAALLSKYQSEDGINVDPSIDLRDEVLGQPHENKLQSRVSQCRDLAARNEETLLRVRRFCMELGNVHSAADLLDECDIALTRELRFQEATATALELSNVKARLLLRERELNASTERADRAEAELRSLRRQVSLAASSGQRGGVSVVFRRRDDDPRLEPKPKPLFPAPSSSPSSGHQAQGGRDEAGPGEARAVIEGIRHQQLFGGEVPAGMSGPLNVLRGALGRALTKLSQDLYSTPTQFIAELLQNADDCVFPEDVTPAVWITMLSDSIRFSSNEVGFTAKDVQALCAIGESTKEGSAQIKAIGKKGIGFKSVFMVTDEPHVLSGDFAFKFSTADGPLGALLPQWLTPDEVEALGLPPAASRRPGTCYHLPMRHGSAARAHPHLELLLRGAAVEPSVLLFLRRLQRIRILDATCGACHDLEVRAEALEAEPGSRRETSRRAGVCTEDAAPRAAFGSHPIDDPIDRPDGEGELAVVHVHKHTWHPPPDDQAYAAGMVGAWERCMSAAAESGAGSRAESGADQVQRFKVLWCSIGAAGDSLGESSADFPQHLADVEMESELALAFPMSRAASCEGDREREPEGEMLYAYLPVCRVGLPFIVHADFDLVSSRQQLHLGSGRNARLRDAVPAAFLSAVRCDAELRRRAAEFVPSLTSITDPFWRPVAARIAEGLRSEQCVLSETGRWCTPLEVLGRPERVPEALLTSQALLEACGMEFAACSVREAELLGCTTFTMHHMLTWLHTPQTIRQVATWPRSWAMALYRYLQAEMTAETIAEVRAAPILRLQGEQPGEATVGCMAGDTRAFLQPGRTGFLKGAGVNVATLSVLVEAVVWQHWRGEFAREVQVWAGLRLIKDHLKEYLGEREAHRVASSIITGGAGRRAGAWLSPDHLDGGQGWDADKSGRGTGDAPEEACAAPEGPVPGGVSSGEEGAWEAAGLRDLRLALCVPSGAGGLRPASHLCLRSVFGVMCERCFARPETESAGDDSGGHEEGGSPSGRPTQLPVKLVPPLGATAAQAVGTRIHRSGDGAAPKLLSVLSVRARVEGGVFEQGGARTGAACASAAVRFGRFCFSTRVTGNGECWIGVCCLEGSQTGAAGGPGGRLVCVALDRAGRLLRWDGRPEEVADSRAAKCANVSVYTVCPGVALAAGDIVTCAVDLEDAVVHFAVNSALLTPESRGSLRVQDAAVALPRAMIGRAVAPLAVVGLGGEVEMQFGQGAVRGEGEPQLMLPRAIAEFPGFTQAVQQERSRARYPSHGAREDMFVGDGWRWTSTGRAPESGGRGCHVGKGDTDGAAKSRGGGHGSHTHHHGGGNDRTGDDSKGLEADAVGGDEAAGWELFLGALGARPHLEQCRARHWWLALTRGQGEDCAVCMQPLAPAKLAGETGGAPGDEEEPAALPCHHKFHRGCILRWLNSDGSEGDGMVPPWALPEDGADTETTRTSRAGQVPIGEDEVDEDEWMMAEVDDEGWLAGEEESADGEEEAVQEALERSLQAFSAIHTKGCPVCRAPATPEVVRPDVLAPQALQLSTNLMAALHDLTTTPVGAQSPHAPARATTLVRYANHPLTVEVLRAVDVPTAGGLGVGRHPLHLTFLPHTFRRFGARLLPYLQLPLPPAAGPASPPLLAVLGQLGVSAELSAPALLNALRVLLPLASTAARGKKGDHLLAGSSALTPHAAVPIPGLCALYAAIDLACEGREGPAEGASGSSAAAASAAVTRAFHHEALIFVPDSARGYRSGEVCLGAHPAVAGMLDKRPLPEVYGGLEAFFCGRLGVGEVDLEAALGLLQGLRHSPLETLRRASSRSWGASDVSKAVPKAVTLAEATTLVYAHVETLLESREPPANASPAEEVGAPSKQRERLEGMALLLESQSELRGVTEGILVLGDHRRLGALFRSHPQVAIVDATALEPFPRLRGALCTAGLLHSLHAGLCNTGPAGPSVPQGEGFVHEDWSTGCTNYMRTLRCRVEAQRQGQHGRSGAAGSAAFASEGEGVWEKWLWPAALATVTELGVEVRCCRYITRNWRHKLSQELSIEAPYGVTHAVGASWTPASPGRLPPGLPPGLILDPPRRTAVAPSPTEGVPEGERTEGAAAVVFVAQEASGKEDWPAMETCSQASMIGAVAAAVAQLIIEAPTLVSATHRHQSYVLTRVRDEVRAALQDQLRQPAAEYDGPTELRAAALRHLMAGDGTGDGAALPMEQMVQGSSVARAPRRGSALHGDNVEEPAWEAAHATEPEEAAMFPAAPRAPAGADSSAMDAAGPGDPSTGRLGGPGGRDGVGAEAADKLHPRRNVAEAPLAGTVGGDDTGVRERAGGAPAEPLQASHAEAASERSARPGEGRPQRRGATPGALPGSVGKWALLRDPGAVLPSWLREAAELATSGHNVPLNAAGWLANVEVLAQAWLFHFLRMNLPGFGLSNWSTAQHCAVLAAAHASPRQATALRPAFHFQYHDVSGLLVPQGATGVSRRASSGDHCLIVAKATDMESSQQFTLYAEELQCASECAGTLATSTPLPARATPTHFMVMSIKGVHNMSPSLEHMLYNPSIHVGSFLQLKPMSFQARCILPESIPAGSAMGRTGLRAFAA
ncbi:hypothetical protein CYMTET_10869 [Cymbomonas tetramitiformis]|uniref:RING-type domain-containing protein n=1 Tax=Cymbomonas tetramitiformis TaxID=36881 RepID=A0AAE0GNG6_9CHLO|nr:hypothetical protein CYMTET_10869 [Cymbomonas tetramitiformis]